jgi:hypothetical protein
LPGARAVEVFVADTRMHFLQVAPTLFGFARSLQKRGNQCRRHKFAMQPWLSVNKEKKKTQAAAEKETFDVRLQSS